MTMEEYMTKVYKVLSGSEKLLRLLYYKPTNAMDDPLDESKPNVLSMDEDEKWAIIQDRIKPTMKVDDLDSEEKCRVLFYAGRRNSTGNFMIAEQELVIDVLTHVNFDEVDLRQSKLCDAANELICNERIFGMGRVTFKNGTPIGTPKSYVGYRLVYHVGSMN